MRAALWSVGLNMCSELTSSIHLRAAVPPAVKLILKVMLKLLMLTLMQLPEVWPDVLPFHLQQLTVDWMCF